MHVLGQYDNGEPLPSDHFKERINRLKSDFSRLSSTHAFSLLDQLVKQRIQLTLVIDFFENVSIKIKLRRPIYMLTMYLDRPPIVCPNGL